MRCVMEIQAAMPWAVVELRMDSAFFSDEMATELETLGVDYTISVPSVRFPELEGMRVFGEIKCQALMALRAVQAARRQRRLHAVFCDGAQPRARTADAGAAEVARHHG